MSAGGGRSRFAGLLMLATLAAATSIMVVLPADTARAHAGFVASDPADGAELVTAPDVVTLTFTEPVDPVLSRVELLDVSGSREVLDGATLPSPDTLRAPLPEGLADGVYTVSWFALSTVDGHLTAGAFTFGIGESPEGVATPVAAPASSPGPSVLGVAGRASLYAGLSLLIALGAVGAGIAQGRLRATRVVAMTAAMLSFAGVLALIAAETRLVGVSAAELMRADAGRAYVDLLLGVAVAGAAAVLVAARPNRGTMALAGVAAIVPVYLRASSGHAAGASWVQEVVQTVHFGAVGVWVGGLAIMGLLLRERRGDDDRPPSEEARRFSATALLAVAIVVGTGLVRSLDETGGVGAVGDTLRTGYGQVLVAKIALALGLIALGAVQRFRSLPRLGAGDPRPLRRLIAAEVVAAVGVFALTGTLTSLPPGGADAVPAARVAQVTATGSDFATTVRVELRLEPGAPGANDVEVTVRDFDTGDPMDADAVGVRFEPVGVDLAAATIELRPDGDVWAGRGSALSIAGTWQATVRVTSGASALEIPLVVTTRTSGVRATVTELPGQPTLTTITFADRTSAQVYVDPGGAGPNQVHLTMFDPAGRELQLGEASLVVIGPDRSAQVVDVLRFGPGHFVANLELEAGRWTFDFTGTTAEGAAFQATVRRTIGAA